MGVGRNKTTQACPELVEVRSAWWRFRYTRTELPETLILASARKVLFRPTPFLIFNLHIELVKLSYTLSDK